MSLTRWHTLPSARAFLPRLALRGYFYIYIYIVDQTCVDDRARRSVYPIAKRKKKKKKRKERKEEKGKTSGGSRRIRSKDLSALSSLGLPSISRWSIFIYNSLRVYIYMIHLDATKINAWPSGSIMRDLWFLTIFNDISPSPTSGYTDSYVREMVRQERKERILLSHAERSPFSWHFLRVRLILSL